MISTIKQITLCLMFAFLTLTAPLFLFGGPLKNKDSPVYQKIIEATGKKTKPICDQNWFSTDCPKVAVVTSGSVDSFQGNKQYNEGQAQILSLNSLFTGLGTVPKHVSVHVDNYLRTADVLTEQGQKNFHTLQFADIVFFNGGSQARHMLCWFNKNNEPNTLFSMFRRRVNNNEVVVMGVAEGASIQSSLTFGSGSSFGHLYFSNLVGLSKVATTSGYLEDRRNGTSGLQFSQNGAAIQGFSFIKEFIIDTDFSEEGRIGRLIPDLNNLGFDFGVGIDIDAALHFDKAIGTIYGNQGVTIVDLKGALKTPAKYFQIKNAIVHYLKNGDVFDFKNRRLSSNKTKITVASQNGFADSQNILGKFEASRLITRLVNQKGIANEGETMVPSEFPSGTAKFSLLFYKGEETEGYKSGTEISAFSVKLDLSVESRQ